MPQDDIHIVGMLLEHEEYLFDPLFLHVLLIFSTLNNVPFIFYYSKVFMLEYLLSSKLLYDEYIHLKFSPKEQLPHQLLYF